jgi:hypothetical protein
MLGSLDGTAHMHILNIGQQAVNKSAKTTIDTGIVLAHKVTTVQDLSGELFSVDDMFLNGCSILLRAPEYENGIPEIHVPATEHSQAFSIPPRYDYEEGGFWPDYILHDPSDSEHRNASPATEVWRQQRTTTALAKSMPSFDENQTAAMTCRLQDCQAVKQVEFVHEESNHAFGAEGVTFGQHQEAGITNIRGVKMTQERQARRISTVRIRQDRDYQAAGATSGAGGAS